MRTGLLARERIALVLRAGSGLYETIAALRLSFRFFDQAQPWEDTVGALFESRRTRERAYFSALSVAQLEYRYASGWAMWITLCFTPETHRSTHVFATLHVEGRWAPAWLVRTIVWPFLRQVARQDRRMLELQESGREHFPNRRPAVTPLDVVRPYLEEAWSGKASLLPPNRELTLYL